MSLTLTGQPGFTEIADSSFASGAPVSDSVMTALNAAAKFAAVRNEQFWGYYKSGETVALPVSPADGYAYSRAELLYVWSIFATGAPLVALNGTQTPPVNGTNTGPGNLLAVTGNVDQATGLVTTMTAYYVAGGAQTNTSDGVLCVVTMAQRNR
jgi:hypothetical protein